MFESISVLLLLSLALEVAQWRMSAGILARLKSCRDRQHHSYGEVQP